MAACKFTIAVRTFCSTAGQNQLVKTPIPVFGIGGRYAAALYSAAVKSKEVDSIEKDFMKFRNLLVEDKMFGQVMKDPTIKKNIKANAIEAIAKKLSLSKSSINCLKLVAENGRLKNFELILSNLKTLMAAHRGEVTCEVISAKPLTDAQKNEIETTLKKFVKGKGNILLTVKVDPSILGGLIVSVGDKYVDMSIATKIRKFTKVLESVI